MKIIYLLIVIITVAVSAYNIGYYTGYAKGIDWARIEIYGH